MIFYSEFASLTHSQLMEKVRALQNLAYQLGVEEGMCVHVLGVEEGTYVCVLGVEEGT